MTRAYLCDRCLALTRRQGYTPRQVAGVPPDLECDNCRAELPVVMYEWVERPVLQRKPGPTEFKECEHGA